VCIPPIVARQQLGKSPPIVARKRLGKNPLITARYRLRKNPPIVARQRLGKNPLSLLGNGSVKNPLIVARQRLCNNVTGVTNTHAAIEDLLDASFSMWPVRIKERRRLILPRTSCIKMHSTEIWWTWPSYIYLARDRVTWGAFVNNIRRLRAL
jgi:hypothetical protein